MPFFSFKSSRGAQAAVPAEKRISTPAGQRLSTIMAGGNSEKPPIPPRSIFRKNILAELEESPKGSVTSSSSPYWSLAWSDANASGKDTKIEAGKNDRLARRCGGWKRSGLFIAIVIAGVIALAVGLAVGLTNKAHSHSSSGSSSAANSQSSAGSSDTGNSDNPTKTSGSTASSSSITVDADFPVGTYSFTTFLDTVETDCTSNTDTWTCWPYTIYNDNKTEAMTTFDWVITSGRTSGSYQISSINNTLSLSFSNVDMKLYSEGKDSERYAFQITMDKEVIPSSALMDDDSSSVCFFNSTTFTAYLYTKMKKDYPSSQETSTSTSYAAWPFAVRAEQSIAGGQDVPNCYETNNGTVGEQITDGLEAEDATTLCSCLYRNYLTTNS